MLMVMGRQPVQKSSSLYEAGLIGKASWATIIIISWMDETFN